MELVTSVLVKSWLQPFTFSFFSLRTRAAFEAKLQKSSRATDFRVPQSICTMFNVMVDAKTQSAKLCAMDLGQEVGDTKYVLETHFL